MDRNIGEIIVKVYAWLMWISAAFGILAGLALLFAPSLLEGAFDQSPILGGIFTGLGVGIGIFVLAMALFDLFVGIGLWRRQNWARYGMLFIAAISLFAFPLGTVYGIITIYLFAFDETIRTLFYKPTTAEHVERRKHVRA